MRDTELKECFSSAFRDEKNSRKHKGLLAVAPSDKNAQEYVSKAKANLALCDLYNDKGYDYKIPEEWFYTLYYCALAILCKFGLESRSQRCTAHFLRYVKDKRLIEYDDEFIERITVYREKDARSDVDEREVSRYGSSVKSEDIRAKYMHMMAMCKKAISHCEDIVYSDKVFRLPAELLK